MFRNTRLRVIALFIVTLAAIAMIAPRETYGQDDRCICGFVNIRVDEAVRCKVTVCMLNENGSRNCVTVAPGKAAVLNCLPNGKFYIVDCYGNLIPLDPDAECTRGIGAGFNCCTVDACFDPSADCGLLRITPSILDVCPCL